MPLIYWRMLERQLSRDHCIFVVLGHYLLSIDNRTLASDSLQLQGLCKLSLVLFNCHFVYFVMQLTVCSCPKLPLSIVFCPLSLSPCHCSLEAAPYLVGFANSVLYVIMASLQYIKENHHQHGYSLLVTIFY